MGRKPRMVIPTKQDIEGKTLICNQDKYGNFTKGKEYKVKFYMYCYVDDDDGDRYTIEDRNLGTDKLFTIKNT